MSTAADNVSACDPAVLLVAVFLHKSPFPPYRRGFFCDDNSIRLSYKGSTVSNTVLTAVGVTVPVVSVSSAQVLQDDGRASVGTHSVCPVVFLRISRKNMERDNKHRCSLNCPIRRIVPHIGSNDIITTDRAAPRCSPADCGWYLRPPVICVSLTHHHPSPPPHPHPPAPPSLFLSLTASPH